MCVTSAWRYATGVPDVNPFEQALEIPAGPKTVVTGNHPSLQPFSFDNGCPRADDMLNCVDRLGLRVIPGHKPGTTGGAVVHPGQTTCQERQVV
jgi:hypothetical protein